MKQLKVIGILVAVVAVCTGGYLVANHYLTDKEEKKEAETKPVTLLQFDSTKVTGLKVDGDEGAFDFQYINGKWELTSKEFEINDFAVSAICNYMSDLNSLKVIDKNPADTSAFGFDDPITLSCTLQDGSAHTLLIGDATPTYEAYYVKLPDENTIYTVDYVYGSVFCASRDTLKNTYFFDVFSSEITDLALARDGKTIYDIAKKDTGWTMNKPLSYQANSAKVTALLDSFTRATVSAFLTEHAEDLATYGLDNPAYEIVAKTENKETTICVGDMISSNEDETMAYGMFKENGQVFMFTKADLSFIEGSTVDLMYPYIYTPNVEDVKEISVKSKDINTTIAMQVDNGIYTFDGTNIPSDDTDGVALFENFYRGIMTLGMSDVDPDATPSGEAEMTITYSLNSGATETISLIPASDTTYWVMRNDSYTGLVTRKKYLTRNGSIEPTYDALKRYVES